MNQDQLDKLGYAGFFVIIGIYILHKRQEEEKKKVIKCTEEKEIVESQKEEEKTKIPILKESKFTNTQLTTDEQDFIHLKFYTVNEKEKSIFENLCADDLVYDKNFVSITEQTSVQNALMEMVRSNCKCGLVFTVSGECIGISDSIDATRCIIKSNERENTNVREMLRQCVIADPCTGMNEINSFLCAGVRCIALKKNDGSFNLVSQAAIVRMIFHKYKEYLDEKETMKDYYSVFTKKLHELRLGNIVPKCCNVHSTARQAFEKIIAYGITSLPICSDDGKACGVISATDSFFAIENANSLELNVLSYVEQSRKQFNISRDVSNIVSCSRENDLESILSLMLHENVHHVYIINNSKPEGVVSFVDILRVIQ
tara:strand:- start:807 stop:1919 length:1113 start_codon:yes stop_codon:yes gene_type:complete